MLSGLFVEVFEFYSQNFFISIYKNFADNFHDFKCVIVFEHDTTYFLPQNLHFSTKFYNFIHWKCHQKTVIKLFGKCH